ncbi:hypothetical protein SDC9_189213 [bioreactor metagenome]|uniref:Uncharacterized protein n=1 Tax=bioreactor metagenome TaxID=1076179 RepID=A0A645HTY8_9ZZZZ
MRGLILPPVILHMSLAHIRPLAVPAVNATSPNVTITRVWKLAKLAASMVEPIATAIKVVITSRKVSPNVEETLSMTPHSRIRLPSIRQEISGAIGGSRINTTKIMTTGNTIFARLETGFSFSMAIFLSASGTRSRIRGGCISGSRAI